jgi:large subunit ribosomal protein L31
MKEELHPTWYPDAKVICACGETWTMGATVPEIRTDICSKCHPFFTGEQRIVDTEGQVDRFMRRLRAREEALREAEERKAARLSPELPITDLELGTRLENVLLGADVEKVGDVLALLEESGDDGLTDIRGVGLKALADVKRALRSRGYTLPGDEEAEETEAEEEAEVEAEAA